MNTEILDEHSEEAIGYLVTRGVSDQRRRAHLRWRCPPRYHKFSRKEILHRYDTWTAVAQPARFVKSPINSRPTSSPISLEAYLPGAPDLVMTATSFCMSDACRSRVASVDSNSGVRPVSCCCNADLYFENCAAAAELWAAVCNSGMDGAKNKCSMGWVSATAMSITPRYSAQGRGRNVPNM